MAIATARSNPMVFAGDKLSQAGVQRALETQKKEATANAVILKSVQDQLGISAEMLQLLDTTPSRGLMTRASVQGIQDDYEFLLQLKGLYDALKQVEGADGKIDITFMEVVEKAKGVWNSLRMCCAAPREKSLEVAGRLAEVAYQAGTHTLKNMDDFPDSIKDALQVVEDWAQLDKVTFQNLLATYKAALEEMKNKSAVVESTV